MSDVINLEDFQNKKQVNSKVKVEEITKNGVASLLHSLHEDNIFIEDPDFQQDLALAFKFIHVALSKQYGLDSPFYEAIDLLKRRSKW